MTQATQAQLDGRRGKVVVHTWSADDPEFVVVLAHGHGEHAGRYEHVAVRLVEEGGAVYAPDHMGHGLSEGERALIEDVEETADDLAAVAAMARAAHPGLPVVLLGHSMGGLIATRLAQRDPSAFQAFALSGPFIGGNPDIEALLGMDPMPEVPIDPDLLSRDPAVGDAYMADELVYHGPFRKPTLEAGFRAIAQIKEAAPLAGLPLLWIHGEEDGLAPAELTRATVEGLGAAEIESHVYPGARHEIFNETNQGEVIGDLVAFIKRVTS
jgi:alpha-beta hydrolase superfamily lysophospholipase